MSSPPRVFVSYSHDSDEHRAAVVALTNRLRSDGIDAWVDAFELHQADWAQWMASQIERADFILCVCTDAWRRRFEGPLGPSQDGGVSLEVRAIRNRMLHDRGPHPSVVAVAFDESDLQHIPRILQSGPSYLVSRDYEQLHALLNGQSVPETTPRPVDAQPRIELVIDDDAWEDWRRVKASQDITRLREHIAQYPGSVTAQDVKSRLRELELPLEAEADWSELKTSEDVQALRAHVARFPGEPSEGLARARIHELLRREIVQREEGEHYVRRLERLPQLALPLVTRDEVPIVLPERHQPFALESPQCGADLLDMDVVSARVRDEDAMGHACLPASPGVYEDCRERTMLRSGSDSQSEDAVRESV